MSFTNNPWSINANRNSGKEISLSEDSFFQASYGQNLIVNCTADAELNPAGSFTSGAGINVFNIGTHTILFDGAFVISAGQQASFAYDDTNKEFVGGV